LHLSHSRSWNPKTRVGDFVFCDAKGGNPQKDTDGGAKAGQKYAGLTPLRHPLISPLFATNVGGLPPLFINVGDAELMREESVTFAARVRAESARGHAAVEFKVWPRMWHVFVAYQEGYGKGVLTPAVDALRECGLFFERQR
jgi:acetyl esterase/lipase